MASFCAKCGSAIPANEQFCTSCGAAVATHGAAPAQPAAAQPAAAPAKSGSSAVKIILIIVAVIVGLGILGLGAITYVGYRVARAVHVNGNGDQVTLHTAEGSFTADTSHSYSAAELGTDIYPGAEGTKEGVKMTLPTGTMVTGVFLTSDSKDKVLAFYKSQLGGKATIINGSGPTIISIEKSPLESVMVTIYVDKSGDGKTQITVTHTTKTKDS
jgi:hypothetical protein